ncbi:MAG: DUF4276 family protein [Fimbriiglobus sp.]
MKITIIVEGRTEKAFKKKLIEHLKSRLSGKMPKLDFYTEGAGGNIPTDDKLKRIVQRFLTAKKDPSDAVIALTDVYTGSTPPKFQTADDAKKKLRAWVGEEPRFFPHVALHDFEAWLLPYWPKIQKLTGSSRKTPGSQPEKVNHGKSPAYWLKEVYETGKKSKSYSKVIDAARILEGEDLTVAIEACPELKAFIERIVGLCEPK